jgi:hypothetical protein
MPQRQGPRAEPAIDGKANSDSMISCACGSTSCAGPEDRDQEAGTGGKSMKKEGGGGGWKGRERLPVTYLHHTKKKSTYGGT